MINKYLLLLAFAGVCLTTTDLHAQTSAWKIDPGNSSVSFQVRHLGISTVRGNISGVNGTILLNEKDITKSSVSATAESATVTTGNDNRDKHLKSDEFFDVTKNTTLQFKSTSLTNSNGHLKLNGDLTLAGVTHTVTLDLDGPSTPLTDRGVVKSGFSATGTLSRKAFNFGQSSPLNTAIGDDVKFTIDVEIDKQ
jgi:polyisoprenoid-binding protein YceI